MSKELEDILDAGQANEVDNKNFLELLNISNHSHPANNVSQKSNEDEEQMSGKKVESINSKDRDSNVEGNNQLNQAVIEYKEEDQKAEGEKPQAINFCEELEKQDKKSNKKGEVRIDDEKIDSKCWCYKCVIQ